MVDLSSFDFPHPLLDRERGCPTFLHHLVDPTLANLQRFARQKMTPLDFVQFRFHPHVVLICSHPVTIT